MTVARRTLRHLAVPFALAGCLTSVQGAGPRTQTPFNRFEVLQSPTYTIDFEHGASDVALGAGATLTSAAGEVIEGGTSLKIAAATQATLRPQALGLEPSKVYILEYRYRILERRGGPCVLDVSATSAGGPSYSLGGVLSGLAADGIDTRSVQITEPDQTFRFSSCGDTVVIDDIRMFRNDVRVRFSEPTLIDFAFPRLANYSLMTPDGIAYANGFAQDEVHTVMARYDLLMGPNSDHLMGASAWVRRLKSLNPDIRILPYKQSFMVQTDGYGYGAYAGVNGLFNHGIAPEWFMRRPSGELLPEVDFPHNVQLDHTPFCSVVDGMTANTYAADFMARTMFPSGLWDGIHFDQPEWYTNPLLGNPAPPIDLDHDGAAEPVSTVEHAWREGFTDFFKGVAARVGYQQLLFGNAGYIPGNPSVLGTLNGWEMEVASPSGIAPGGDWVTDEASGWYRLLNNYLYANVYARAPQIVALEFTGRDLGQPTGGQTPNFYPARTMALEARDFRRMRLGLTTALLGNGFFEYDLVDNTTAPLWFDEYSVSNGVATGDGRGKGYLGQPLAAPVELEYPFRMVTDVDFESAPPSEFIPGPGTISTTPAEVIGGSQSLVVRQERIEEGKWLFFNSAPLTPGKTYQLFADYRILAYHPTTFRGLLGIGFSDETGALSPGRAASLYLPDTEGAGQQGTLRASVRVTTGGVFAMGGLSDAGSVAIDNIRLIEGTGGVWRRDFENGIVLVNPTPERLFVAQASVAGPLGRTGIRRLEGPQQPLVNSGAAVTDGIWLEPADGIVLLATTRSPAPLTVPTAVTATPFGTSVVMFWHQSSGPAAGYKVRYGESPNDLTRTAVAGPGPGLTLEGLHPGATYYLEVAAFDFRGRVGPAAPRTQVTMAGASGRRPTFIVSPATPTVVAGAYMRIDGSDLADETVTPDGPPFVTRLGSTVVQVNGVDAPLVSVSPTTITFVVPWEIAGRDAVVNVIRDGVDGVERLVAMAAGRPWVVTWAGSEVAIALHRDGMPVTHENRAIAGEAIDVIAIGLGPVVDHPENGVMAGGARAGTTADPPTVLIGGIAADVSSAALMPGLVGVYRVTVTVPAALPDGLIPIELRVAGTSSNGALLPCE